MHNQIMEIRDTLIEIKTLWNLGNDVNDGMKNIVRAKQKLTGLIKELEKFS